MLTKKSDVTTRKLYEIEVALAKHDKFSYLKNIVAFNVTGFPVYHECDMLVISKAGYLTEIEIKRSWSDFLADFSKPHRVKPTTTAIKFFYYCIPLHLLEFAYKELEDRNVVYTGVITYDEDLKLSINPYKKWGYETNNRAVGWRKLFLEEQLNIARLGSMRVITLKEKLTEIT